MLGNLINLGFAPTSSVIFGRLLLMLFLGDLERVVHYHHQSNPLYVYSSPSWKHVLLLRVLKEINWFLATCRTQMLVNSSIARNDVLVFTFCISSIIFRFSNLVFFLFWLLLVVYTLRFSFVTAYNRPYAHEAQI